MLFTSGPSQSGNSKCDPGLELPLSVEVSNRPPQPPMGAEYADVDQLFSLNESQSNLRTSQMSRSLKEAVEEGGDAITEDDDRSELRQVVELLRIEMVAASSANSLSKH